MAVGNAQVRITGHNVVTSAFTATVRTPGVTLAPIVDWSVISWGDYGEWEFDLFGVNGFSGAVTLSTLNLPYGASMVPIHLNVPASGPVRARVTVSTTLEIDLDDPRWQAWLVDSVAGQAKEGARQLRDELIAQQGLPVTGFVPLCAVLPAAGAGR